MVASPIDPFLKDSGIFVLDGGLATELENRGHVLDSSLWSAELLRTQPDAIRSVHLAYLEAGADCIVTASYQASIEGFCSMGLTRTEAENLLRRSVEVAEEARRRFAAEQRAIRRTPLVAASIGPYGAYLADGSEYRGAYEIDEPGLRAFHEPRWHVLVGCRPDLLAIETIPSFPEATVVRDLLETTPEMPAWISFACRDGESINDGTSITRCVRLFSDLPQVVAIGINCTSPEYLASLILRIREAAPGKEIVVYPNSGEIYDPVGKRWAGTSDPIDFGSAARTWYASGARLIGGCCRIGPVHIRAARRALNDVIPPIQ